MPNIQRGLIVKAPWARALAAGEKQWELRNRPTQVRGQVAILEGGSCLAVGTMDIVDCIGPLGPCDLAAAARQGLILPNEVSDADREPQFAWVVANARMLSCPLPYQHPRGAVVWVKIDEGLACALQQPPSRRPRTR